jgi:hypothetical protein
VTSEIDRAALARDDGLSLVARPWRLAAWTWHAATQQLASCAAAEILDGLLIRPGFAVGKLAANVVWCELEAAASSG